MTKQNLCDVTRLLEITNAQFKRGNGRVTKSEAREILAILKRIKKDVASHDTPEFAALVREATEREPEEIGL